jgi:integrase
VDALDAVDRRLVRELAVDKRASFTGLAEFKMLCGRAGIPPYRVHDLRHTAAHCLSPRASTPG